MTALLALSLLAGAELSPEARAWWRHVEVLADDKMEGRDTGSPGHRMAAEYVQQEFERAGLKPGGTQGYMQPVKFRVRTIDEDKSSIELIRAEGIAERVQFGREATISMRVDPKPVVEAGLVFAGYGFAVPEKGYDDLAGLDLKGKLVVYIQGVPEGIPAELSAHYQSAGERWNQLKAAGAIGTIGIPNPKASDIPWARASRSRLLPSMDLADSKYVETAGMLLSMAWNPERADRLFQGTGHTIEKLLALADTKKPLPRFPLDVKLRVKTAVVRGEVESQNVIGVLPGSDPQLSKEFVALSAHLDHVGKTRVIEGDGIHNGAMDNASGIASLIEIAKMLRGSSLKRSVAFVAVTGEEKGLRGSRYFATNPTLDGRMVANLNMDMFLPITELKVLRVLGLNESDLGPTFRAAAEANGVPVQGDPRPERNSFIRSDQYSFVREGIPAINAGFGYQLGSPEAEIHKKWLAERYHGVTDDTSQPVFKEDAAKFNRILADFTKRVANQPKTPKWNEDSFFRRFEKK
jgi:hypothetical protein